MDGKARRQARASTRVESSGERRAVGVTFGVSMGSEGHSILVWAETMVGDDADDVMMLYELLQAEASIRQLAFLRRHLPRKHHLFLIIHTPPHPHALTTSQEEMY